MPKRGQGATIKDAAKAQQKTERRHAETPKQIWVTGELIAETRYQPANKVHLIKCSVAFMGKTQFCTLFIKLSYQYFKYYEDNYYHLNFIN